MSDSYNAVFVYGILKIGNRVGYIKGVIHDLGSFPATVDIGKDGSWVKGELRYVSDEELLHFDRIEGAHREDGMYRRIKTTVYEEDKETVMEEAWVYEWRNDRETVNKPCGEEWNRRWK